MKENSNIIQRKTYLLSNLEERQQKDLVLYSPSNCAKFSNKIRTVKDAIELPSKSLGDFKRQYGKDWVIGYVSMWLIELNDNSNVKQKMSDAQIDFTAERIYETYSLKVTDLTLFFRNIKEGKYGSFYENLSQEKIMQWLSKYFDQRCEYAMMLGDKKHQKVNINTLKVHPDVIEKMFKGVGEENVEFQHEKNGLGKRSKGIVSFDLITEIKSKTTEELKNYLAYYDQQKPGYNEFIFQLVEKEIDLRNNQSKIKKLN